MFTSKLQKQRGEALDHTLLYGPPGSEKPRWPALLQMRWGSISASPAAPAIEKAGDLAALLTNLSENDILFIDEIHRFDRAVEGDPLPGDGGLRARYHYWQGAFRAFNRLDLRVSPDRGDDARRTAVKPAAGPLRRDAPSGTLFRGGALSYRGTLGRHTECAVRARGRYSRLRAAAAARPALQTGFCAVCAILRRCAARGTIDKASADMALRAQEIDELGLDAVDRRMLKSIMLNYGGGPVGLDTLAATIGEEAITLEDVYEPYLMQIGFLSRTPRGRCVTLQAYRHLNLEPADGQQML